MNTNTMTIKEFENHISLRLLNKAANKELIKECSHIDCCGIMAAVPYWSESGKSVPITKEKQRKILRLTDDELLAIGRKNSLSEGFDIIGIYDKLDTMLEGLPPELIEQLSPDMPNILYVVTNKSECYGAVAIISKQTLDDIAKVILEQYYFIIPSSVHEIIVIPASAVSDPAGLQEMLIAVNESEVKPEERLSSNILRYDGFKLQVCNSLDDLIKQLHIPEQAATAARIGVER